jgi:hypothetical protein
MGDPGWIAPIKEAASEPHTDAKCAFGLAQQEQATVRGLAAAIEIDCELLAMDGWQVERERLIVVHCGVALGRDAKHSCGNELLRVPNTLRHTHHQPLKPDA